MTRTFCNLAVLRIPSLLNKFLLCSDIDFLTIHKNIQINPMSILNTLSLQSEKMSSLTRSLTVVNLDINS